MGNAARPILQPLLDADLRLSCLRLYRFARRYAWALPPLIIVGALQLNNHLYYDFFTGYDMPQHFNNTYSILSTGTMPPPPMTSGTYEAFQAPLFYILMAWVRMFAGNFAADPVRQVIPVVLFIGSMLWMLLAVGLIQVVMRRAHGVLRALTLSVIMLFPMNITISAMFGNDLPILALGVLGMMTLWLMFRSGRYLERTWWVRAAAIIGIATAFKTNGSILMATYVLLAVQIVWLSARAGRYDLVRRVTRISLIGLPLMIVPLAINTVNTARYANNPMGVMSPSVNLLDNSNILFFATFNPEFFQTPFETQSGVVSFWDLQYVTLHNDYFRAWHSPLYRTWPPSEMMQMSNAAWDLMPIERFNTAVTLQYLAVPVTLVMLFAFFYAFYRVIMRPRQALRDGSIVVVVFTLVAQAAQFLPLLSFADLTRIIVHARHIGFLYPFLFIVGIFYLWDRLLRRRSPLNNLLTAFLSLDMIAYVFFAMKLMWLPPLF